MIDLTAVLLGPYTSQQLGDLGADVIKVESPLGDSTRHIGPHRNPGMGAMFLNLNRNKRSIALDLKLPAARAALLRLLATADVFVHTLRPKAIDGLGLGHAAVREVRPDIVYCAAYGYAAAGPYGDEPAYDDLIQAASGLAALLAEAHGGEPRYVPTVLADKVVGLVALNAILTALFHRERTGEGQAVEVPMFETMAAFVLLEHLSGAVYEPPVGGAGYRRLLEPARKPFKALDGYIGVLPYTDLHWRRFFEIAGCSELAEDPRFVTITSRTEHIGDLYALVERTMAQNTVAHWRHLLGAAQIPNMRVNTLPDLLDNEQLAASELLTTVRHPSEGAIRHIANPVNFSHTPARLYRGAPRLGEHGVEILRQAGMSAAEIDRLINAGGLHLPVPSNTPGDQPSESTR